MRLRSFLFALCLAPFLAGAQQKTNDTALPRLSAVEARDHIGEQAVVTGKVAEVHISEKVVRLNLEQKFPKQPFTAVVFSPNTNRFGDLKRFEGKPVEITGKIADYRGRPQIVMTATNQLQVAAP